MASAAKRVSPLVPQTGLSREAIAESLFIVVPQWFGGTLSELTDVELADAEKLQWKSTPRRNGPSSLSDMILPSTV